MEEVIFLLVLGLIWIIFASIQDIRKTEVPNWIPLSLVVLALGFRFFYGVFSESFGLFFQGLIGLGIFLILGNVFYYLKMFAGGDTKLMVALGAILPLSQDFFINIKIFGLFLLLFFLSGAVYGLVITTILSIRNFKKFKKGFSLRIKKNKIVIISATLLGILLMILGIFEAIFFSFGILIFIFPYLFLYAKTIDDDCMIKKMPVRNVTEGDWLAEKLKIRGKIIRPSWDGLSKEEIRLIRKKYKTIKIRQGIPFVPVFLIAFLIFIYAWQHGLWSLFW